MAGAKPKIVLLSLGGTIAMVEDREGGGGVTPQLTGRDLIAAVPELAEVADVEAEGFRTLPSAALTFDDVGALAARIEALLAAGADGVVVTQGTDTIEETAFALDLLVGGDRPVVVTGAMRNPTVAGAEGPANLLGAVRVAAAPGAAGLGTLVVIDDEIHAAQLVRKSHTQSVGAFVSEPGPIGWISEGVPTFVLRPRTLPSLPAIADRRPRVGLVAIAFDDDGALVRAAGSAGYAGLVIEGLGGGHVPATVVDDVAAVAAAMPVVLATRIGRGETLRRTYGFAGSEIDLLGRGALCSGVLDSRKARIVLTLLLRAGLTGTELHTAFARYAAPR